MSQLSDVFNQVVKAANHSGGGRGMGYGGLGFNVPGFPQKKSSPFFHYGGGGVFPHPSSAAPSVPSLRYSEMSPESTLIEFISASASFAGVKKCSLRDLEFEIMKVCPNNIMPANAAAWYMGKKRFYDDFELLPLLLKNHEKRFAIKGGHVEFLDAYNPTVARKKLAALVSQGVVAYFTHKIEEYGVYFFDPLYYENTEPFHANLVQETNFQGNTVKLLPKFFALHKDKFVYQKISPYLVTISREPVEVKVNVTCVVVSMVDNQFGILQFNGEGGKTEKAMFSANSLYKDGYNFKGDPVKLPHMCFDGYRVPAKGDPSKESIWVAVLVWSGRKPSPKFCSTRDDLTFPGMPSHSLGGIAAPSANDAISNECMQIGEILAIQKYGAIASLRKDTDERAFIPGWSHEHVRSGASFLVTSQGVELALKDLVAFYVDPKKKPRKEFKAVGCNVMVLKHGGKVEKTSKSSKPSVTDSGESSDGLKKGKKKKLRDRRTSTKSGASSANDEADGAKISKKAKDPAKERKRRVSYKEVLLTAEIPEEDDNYDSDFDPPFIPPAIPDPDLDYDEYSDGEIPEDEVKELEKEGEAHLDVEDLRKKMMEAKLEADKAKAEAREKAKAESKEKETGEGKDEKAAEAEVEKSKEPKDPADHGQKPEVETEK